MSVVNNQAVAAAGVAALTICIAATAVTKPKRKRLVPKLRRAAIFRPIRSFVTTQWKRLLTYGTAADFIVTVNLTKDCIVHGILPYFDQERLHVNFGSPYRVGHSSRGRRAQLDSIDLVGLALYYLKSRDPIFKMCLTFGVVLSSAYVWLDFALTVLMRVVRRADLSDFRVCWPTVDEMHASAALLRRNRRNGSMLDGIFAIMDGGRMPCSAYTNPELQNAYWEGFTQKVEVTNLFVWSFDGCIIHAAMNYPGSWHDSKLAATSGLYFPNLSDERTPPGFALLADSAFPYCERSIYGKIVRARKSNEIGRARNASKKIWSDAIDLVLDRQLPSERQSAEWGFCALKSPFKRLTVPVPADSLIRKRLLVVTAHLYNYRVRRVGLNQIRTVYSSAHDNAQLWVLEMIRNTT